MTLPGGQVARRDWPVLRARAGHDHDGRYPAGPHALKQVYGSPYVDVHRFPGLDKRYCGETLGSQMKYAVGPEGREESRYACLIPNIAQLEACTRCESIRLGDIESKHRTAGFPREPGQKAADETPGSG